MRTFNAEKVKEGHVRTELHLEFGDFRRVERALEKLEPGRYRVGLDDIGGGETAARLCSYSRSPRQAPCDRLASDGWSVCPRHRSGGRKRC